MNFKQEPLSDKINEIYIQKVVAPLLKKEKRFLESQKIKFLWSFIKSYLFKILNVYANVWFSENKISGLFFISATFSVPQVGFSGLLGFIFSDFAIRFFCPSISDKKKDLICCNGVLSALAAGFTYEFSYLFIIILVAASFLNLLISFFLMGIVDRYAGIPVLSLPFVLTSWIIISSVRLFNDFRYTLDPIEASWLFSSFPDYLASLLKAFGTVFFQTNLPGSILVLAGVFIFSRQAFLLGLTGTITASLFFMLTGNSGGSLSSAYAGFNFTLTAIAVGGIFTVPSIFSFVLAAASSLVAAVIYSSSVFFLAPFDLSPLALPFVVTTDLLFYILKYGLDYSEEDKKWLKIIPTPMKTPEDNLIVSKNKRLSFINSKKPFFYLPVSGSWRITQGFHGRFTHKELWAHGIDFEVTDNDCIKYKNQGFELQDYYSWNMPVFSPGHGKVVHIVNNVEDNLPGRINTSKNFGNLVMIWHYGDIYSVMSHLAKGSVSVKIGDVLRPGDIIGKVGNSGRSPFPHLHFQVQQTMMIGAPTIPFEFINFTENINGNSLYHLNRIPEENSIVKNMEKDNTLTELFSFYPGSLFKFRVNAEGKTWIETWETCVDLYGRQYFEILGGKGKLLFFITPDSILFKDYEGRDQTALKAFFLGQAIIPFAKERCNWAEVLPENHILSGLKSVLNDFISPFYEFFSLESFSTISQKSNEWKEINTLISLKQNGSSVKNIEVSTIFDSVIGIKEILMKDVSTSKILFKAERIE